QLTGAFTQPEFGSQLSSVHLLWSLQSTTVLWQPDSGSQLSFVQRLWSSQSRVVWVQPEAGSHASTLQRFPLLPSRGALTHPDAGSQLSFVHLLWSLQSVVVCTQTPATQVSLVQALLSLLQGVPSGWCVSGGQSPTVPVQLSGRSQSPAAGRQMVVSG